MPKTPPDRPTTGSRSDRRPRRRQLVLTLAAVAVALTVTGVAVLGAQPSTTAARRAPSNPTAIPAPATSPGVSSTTPATTTPAPMSTSTAGTVVAAYVRSIDRLTPTSSTAALERVVRGAALAEVQAEQLENNVNGWTETGSTRVTAVHVLRTGTSGSTRTAVVQACIDSSAVTLRTSAGKPVYPGTTGNRRNLNLYSLEYLDGGWRVVRHSFPSDPSC